jgi:para-aminobenzoate synthetase/4-amino-4-deoxychorismate lyase
LTISTPFVLLDDSLGSAGLSYLFADPLRIVSVSEPGEVQQAVVEIVRASSQGLYAAGFLSYELGYLLEPRLTPLLPPRRALPLIWMGLYRERRELTPPQTRQWLEDRAAANGGGFRLGEVGLSWSREQYRARCQRVLDYIAAGDVYQINLTCKGKFAFEGDPAALYLELRRRQKVAYGALISAPDFHILSLSPELFLRVGPVHLFFHDDMKPDEILVRNLRDVFVARLKPGALEMRRTGIF